MLHLRKYVLFCLLSFVSVVGYAQKSTVRATIQPSDILIGEQAVITIEVISPKDRSILFPVFKDTIVTGVEVLGMDKPDTIMTEVMTISQRYIVTSFDSTLYNIPHLAVVDGLDTLLTNNLGLKVTSPQLNDSVLAYLEKIKNKETDSIDFAKLQITDIKPIQEPPFVWQDYILKYLIPILIVLALAIISLIVYFLLKKRKKGYYFKPKVVLPPHVVAFDKLNALKDKKLDQKDQEKEYYMELTDIIRTYIKNRFEVNAPEMLTSEIVENIANNPDLSYLADNLEQILTLADLVKFAKYKPYPDENDSSLKNSYLFVDKTKKEEEPVVVKEKIDVNTPQKVATKSPASSKKDKTKRNKANR